ncbi:1-(5-phosphoribosyl)-5-[(5-phosphoribosylamino)methylideneamino]imidazole-4-carboxamide isomerase [Pseudalkalibacillus salsuginis]|uniref:1-(5-phosphoribosyl)-5-[(5- phosphoribosylamino)methylideneamino]imidazole-4- carboxamide isomerase n=1 Tax=Pseudalkalibacillus salsuginis TaxID=2910972 RepID=UPI001F17356C|nr:1-(5-phosphoribosyl)-5-[(5-phosphoribosylamino)methylideneamino]imidazole-4-carboxamide isomerase [Pseudalkalibacillus salsuginis]MCF6410231.1 1-(5-phosphoribosyl)-5-[(5-phosphoribosylamino)methylideneamino]imidazole-4-carboxamide isomerase [Pseudalkalibacillus salsuginis]
MKRFELYPAIDMRGGKCVRLFQGDYEQETVYGDSPFGMAKLFADHGAKWIHMVDLDGAKTAEKVNHKHVLQVASELEVKVQIGGGIRTEEDIDFYLRNGVDRVILGSVAVKNPVFTKDMLHKYEGKIAIGLDARDGYVATEGWLNDSKVKAVELAKELAEAGAMHFIFTDISRDGTLEGPNVEAIAELARESGAEVIASGGVSSLEDLHVLAGRQQDGIQGAIIGKALYTERFTLSEALEKVGQ